jgi:hypothetical protein
MAWFRQLYYMGLLRQLLSPLGEVLQPTLGRHESKRALPEETRPPHAPFPFSDWTYGGAPDIGAPDCNTYPLMSALKLENSRTKVYGWVAASVNFSTSAQNNFPLS